MFAAYSEKGALKIGIVIRETETTLGLGNTSLTLKRGQEAVLTFRADKLLSGQSTVMSSIMYLFRESFYLPQSTSH